MSKKQLTWRDVLNKFKGFTEAQLSLPIIISKGKLEDYVSLEKFCGFKTIGPRGITQLTGRDVVNILTNFENLNDVVDHSEYFDKFSIGLSKVYLEWVAWEKDFISDDDGYTIIQEYVDGARIPEDNIIKKEFDNYTQLYRLSKYIPYQRELIEPGKVIIIDTTDGFELIDSKDEIILE